MSSHSFTSSGNVKSWKEAAGRNDGSDGYQFGDLARTAVRKAKKSIVKSLSSVSADSVVADHTPSGGESINSLTSFLSPATADESPSHKHSIYLDLLRITGDRFVQILVEGGWCGGRVMKAAQEFLPSDEIAYALFYGDFQFWHWSLIQELGELHDGLQITVVTVDVSKIPPIMSCFSYPESWSKSSLVHEKIHVWLHADGSAHAECCNISECSILAGVSDGQVAVLAGQVCNETRQVRFGGQRDRPTVAEPLCTEGTENILDSLQGKLFGEIHEGDGLRCLSFMFPKAGRFLVSQSVPDMIFDLSQEPPFAGWLIFFQCGEAVAIIQRYTASNDLHMIAHIRFSIMSFSCPDGSVSVSLLEHGRFSECGRLTRCVHSSASIGRVEGMFPERRLFLDDFPILATVELQELNLLEEEAQGFTSLRSFMCGQASDKTLFESSASGDTLHNLQSFITEAKSVRAEEDDDDHHQLLTQLQDAAERDKKLANILASIHEVHCETAYSKTQLFGFREFARRVSQKLADKASRMYEKLDVMLTIEDDMCKIDQEPDEFTVTLLGMSGGELGHMTVKRFWAAGRLVCQTQKFLAFNEVVHSLMHNGHRLHEHTVLGHIRSLREGSQIHVRAVQVSQFALPSIFSCFHRRRARSGPMGSSKEVTIWETEGGRFMVTFIDIVEGFYVHSTQSTAFLSDDGATLSFEEGAKTFKEGKVIDEQVFRSVKLLGHDSDDNTVCTQVFPRLVFNLEQHPPFAGWLCLYPEGVGMVHIRKRCSDSEDIAVVAHLEFQWVRISDPFKLYNIRHLGEPSPGEYSIQSKSYEGRLLTGSDSLLTITIDNFPILGDLKLVEHDFFNEGEVSTSAVR